MTKLQSHSTSNPTSFAQKAAVEALLGPQESVQEMLAEYKRRREFVVQRLRAIPGVKCQNHEAPFTPTRTSGWRWERTGFKTR